MRKIERNKGYNCEKDGIHIKLVDSPETTRRIKSQKRRKRIVGWSILSVLLFVFLLNIVIMPLTSFLPRVEDITVYTGDNPYIVFDKRTMISAHRAGGDLAPEETMLAFELCMTATDYVVDIVEFDLHITKDNKLVLLHDGTVDRTSNSQEYFGEKKVKVIDRTYAELRNLNMGENFQDTNGNFPYRGLRGQSIPNNVRILSLDEILTYLKSMRGDNLNYIIEIKDGGSDGERAMDILYQTLNKFDIAKTTIVGTFKDNVTKHLDKKYPDLIRSASIAEVVNFYYAFLYNVPLSNYKIKYDVLQIPYDQFVLNLGTASLIDYAHKYNVAVQYWTINDENKIKELVKNGADAIITDNPAKAYKVIFDK